MRRKVSSYSGWAEEAELKWMELRRAEAKAKREAQISAIRAVLDKMPYTERRAVLAEIIRRYQKELEK